MSLSLRIEVTNDKQVIAKLKRLGFDLKEFPEAMKEIGKALARYYSGPAFLSQGGVFGQKWASLSPAYQAYKAKEYRAFANSILVRGTGADSMQNEFEYVATKTEVVIGNRAPYFKYHQSAAPRTKIPRRQMMGVNDPVRDIVRDIIDEDVKKKLEKL